MLALCIVLAMATSAPIHAAPVLPELTGHVVDAAGLFRPADREALEAELAAFEAKTSDQVVVVTVPSLQGLPIEEFGIALGRQWGIGQEGKDNGIIVLVAPKERKVRFEVGRGLEPLLPDGKAGTIIRQVVLPAFRRGDFAGGIKAGVAEIRAVLEGDKAELEVRSKRKPPEIDYTALIVFAFWLTIVVLIISAQIKAARHSLGDGRSDNRRLGRRSRPVIFIPGGSGSWGGGSGSSGGGFSGGGGSFGGGGASGDW